jgi:hypothetical protein
MKKNLAAPKTLKLSKETLRRLEGVHGSDDDPWSRQQTYCPTDTQNPSNWSQNPYICC